MPIVNSADATNAMDLLRAKLGTVKPTTGPAVIPPHRMTTYSEDTSAVPLKSLILLMLRARLMYRGSPPKILQAESAVYKYLTNNGTSKVLLPANCSMLMDPEREAIIDFFTGSAAASITSLVLTNKDNHYRDCYTPEGKFVCSCSYKLKNYIGNYIVGKLMAYIS